MTNLIGRTLGQYEITEVIGQGGMATVYKGYQANIDRYVAIKVLPPHPSLNDQFKERFQREARTVGSLQHPHILPLYDYGTEDDLLYLVMAYVDGGSLSDLIDRGPMPPETVADLLRPIGRALDYAHRQGVIHRDIKPANILIDSEGHPFLADFGIVKRSVDDKDLTGTSIVGTPAYLSPEQAQGTELDSRSDIYSLGIMAYEMLTGQQPFRANTPLQVILAHVQTPPPDLVETLPDASVELRAVMSRVMAKNPDDRYQTAGEFAQAFNHAVQPDVEATTDMNRSGAIKAALEGSETGPETRQPATQVFDTPPENFTPDASPTPTVSEPTNIIRQGVDSRLVIAGFAIVAVVLVFILLVMSQTPSDQPTPTAPAVVAETDVPAPTENAVTVSGDETADSNENAASEPLTTEPTFGGVAFSSADVPGDTITLRLEDMDPPADGAMYVAWLLNTSTGETLRLDSIVTDAFGGGTLVYSAEAETNLPATYNAVIITQEDAEADEPPIEPSEDVVYSGAVPTGVSEALAEIFVTSEAGIGGVGSLLDSAKTEAQFAAQHAGLAANASTVGGMRNHAEHTLNILNGTEIDHDGNGRPQNPGRGIGLYAMLDAIEAQIDAVITAPDAPVSLQTNAELIRVCTINVRRWTDRVVELEELILAAESVEAVEAEAVESTELMNHIRAGFDANENGRVEPFENECGLLQIDDFGLEFARFDLLAGGLDVE